MNNSSLNNNHMFESHLFYTSALNQPIPGSLSESHQENSLSDLRRSSFMRCKPRENTSEVTQKQIYMDMVKFIDESNIEKAVEYDTEKHEIKYENRFEVKMERKNKVVEINSQQESDRPSDSVKHSNNSKEESASIEQNQFSSQNPALRKKPKNQTKNISKNYGKAILTYILRKENRPKVEKVLNMINSDKSQTQKQLKLENLLKFSKRLKKEIDGMKYLRSMWSDGTYGQVIRILSEHFLRRETYSYIIEHSRMKADNRMSHLLYRDRIRAGVRDPQSFNFIKE